MSSDIIITGTLTIPAGEIDISAIRAQGAGGQNVNKVASAIHLRFDIAGSPSLPDELRARLLESNDKRITSAGVLVIKSQNHRTQEQNRRAAIARLREFVEAGMHTGKPRKASRPPKSAIEQRLSDKRRRSKTKQDRAPVRGED